MAVKIRLARTGRHKLPFYRVVVADSEAPRGGKFIEKLGTYDPNVDPAAITLDEEKTLKWLGEGATPTSTAKSILKRSGIIEKFQQASKG